MLYETGVFKKIQFIKTYLLQKASKMIRSGVPGNFFYSSIDS